MKNEITISNDGLKYLIIELYDNKILKIIYYENFKIGSEKYYFNQNFFNIDLKNNNCFLLSEDDINKIFIKYIFKFIKESNYFDYYKDHNKLHLINIDGLNFIKNIDKFLLKEKLNDTLKEKSTSKKINKI